MTLLLIYLLPLLVVLWIYLRRRRGREREHVRRLNEALQAGLVEPPSLHPAIDPMRCCGSASCVRACPEGALGIIGGKAQLINAAACIGHGACHASCPVGAITLVFGTARRGMDIPTVKPNFETNVPGLFIAGELGGMGLIRKAAEQGRQAIAAIQERARRIREDAIDVVIVGAGPAGLAAGLGAMERGMGYVLLEQEDGLGGTIYHYPRNKIAMTAPMTLPIVGKVRFSEVSKEALLGFWQSIVDRTRLEVSFCERMESLTRAGPVFVVKTSRSSYRAKAVLLAIGRRGTPRKLGVPGEELPKVVYRLVDPEQYAGRKVLVVGGGDSALEAALAVAAQPGAAVTLSYRGEAFSRVKAKNRERLEQARDAGQVRVILQSNVREIRPDAVRIERLGSEDPLPNDAVIVSAGGVLPSDFLRSIGVEVQTKYGTA
ncbi:MAG TPA: NAD(P)-binding domain-containing protein [Usitatibacter sp.]|nr:NAD(P)-binding domain-containing protein [Usitatibacter sp.]